MAFQFTLEAVRRFRQSVEDREADASLGLCWLCRTGCIAGGMCNAPSPAAADRLQTALHQGLQQAPHPWPSRVQCWTAGCLRGLASRQALLRSQLQQLHAEVARQTTHSISRRGARREVLESSARPRSFSDYRLTQQRQREQARLDETVPAGTGAARSQASICPVQVGKPLPSPSIAKPLRYRRSCNPYRPIGQTLEGLGQLQRFRPRCPARIFALELEVKLLLA